MNDKKDAKGCDSVRSSSETTISTESNEPDSSRKETHRIMSCATSVLGIEESKDKNETELDQALGFATTTEDQIVSSDSEAESDFDLNQAAGVVLLEHIVKEIIEETKKLQDEIHCQQPLLDCLNKVELHFGIENQAFGVPGLTLPRNEASVQALGEGKNQNYDENSIEVISTTFDDSVVVELELIKLHLHDCKPIPLRKMGKGILLVSNQIAETLYPTRHYAPEITVLEQADEPSLFLHLYGAPKTLQDDTEVCLVGQIECLSQADRIAVKNNTYEENEFLFTQYFLSGNGLNSPDAVFMPKHIKFARNHIQEIRLLANFVQTTNLTIIPNWHHPSNDIRRSIINALGNKSDKTFLRENSKLKYKQEIISNVREMIDSVRIFHDGGSIVLRLSEGQLITDYIDGHSSSTLERRSRTPSPAWVLFVSNNLLYNNTDSLNMSVSGVEMGAAGLSISPGYNGQSKVHHCFNLNALVTSTQCSAEHSYAVTEVVFRLDSIESTLSVLGIDVAMLNVE
ncbi:hypothetical protein HJC23_005566 [Cyclotella cryptica]|uniref:Uncharacterized protein n=1 Tax=Cyclotella cryptica TaxID=29204 RepID=A0ABD3PY16_9STRA|eukprot:CCRYP_010677-RA/>CCRYP_010677-RA protein AED:0.22 eAED:0.22 QI:0/-1/0/1/-1/1/1/0/513